MPPKLTLVILLCTKHEMGDTADINTCFFKKVVRVSEGVRRSLGRHTRFGGDNDVCKAI